MDLNIIARSKDFENESKKDLIAKILTAFKLGYEVVALNTIIDGKNLVHGKEIKIPEPLIVQLGKEALSEVHIEGKDFKVLSRLTTIVSDNYQCHRLMQSPITKKYDLLALQPTDLKIFQHICGSVEFDLISLDLTGDLPFTLRRNNIKQATERGILFEITYSPCIGESLPRRHIISNANVMAGVMLGKNIIISSGATRAIQLRGPKDIANLGRLFSLKQEQAVAAVTSNCKKALIHSDVRRKTGFGVISVQALEDVAPSEQWLKEACTYLNTLDNKDVTLGTSPENKTDENDSIPEKRVKLDE